MEIPLAAIGLAWRHAPAARGAGPARPWSISLDVEFFSMYLQAAPIKKKKFASSGAPSIGIV
jgi:hypothetical protein